MRLRPFAAASNRRHSMPLPNPNTGNFCCFGLRTRVSADLPEEPQVEAGLYATTNAPFHIDEWWQKQLGEIELAEIDKCTLFLLALTSEFHIDIRDLNKQLSFH